ncbi:ImmA/IrrE family metallo-endopeptidase [Tsukamurella paurometabola]|uniref:ImmA/IrrE family metallo-endopeptidase n=1 Tax=Tsukamurella paurometabola TaxID=2061 RepID=UPI0011C022F5|nr:ImmA/IrrE family metallo-endopeptidase [Tsukamurella paurometabola]
MISLGGIRTDAAAPETVMQWTVIDLADAMRLARGLGEEWSTAPELVQVVAARRDRPIDVTATDLTGTGITGTVLAGRDRDTIVHATGLPPFFAEHVIFHELGHLVCGHLDDAEAGERIRFRSAHSNPAHEHEAELVATAFAQVRSERGRHRRRVADDGGFIATLAPHMLSR